jgi:hypothetical protein
MVSSFHFSLPSIQAKHLTLTTAWHLTSRGVWWWYKMWSPSHGRLLIYSLNFKLQINHRSHISSYWPKQTQSILAVVKPNYTHVLHNCNKRMRSQTLFRMRTFPQASDWSVLRSSLSSIAVVSLISWNVRLCASLKSISTTVCTNPQQVPQEMWFLGAAVAQALAYYSVISSHITQNAPCHQPCSKHDTSGGLPFIKTTDWA